MSDMILEGSTSSIDDHFLSPVGSTASGPPNRLLNPHDEAAAARLTGTSKVSVQTKAVNLNNIFPFMVFVQLATFVDCFGGNCGQWFVVK